MSGLLQSSVERPSYINDLIRRVTELKQRASHVAPQPIAHLEPSRPFPVCYESPGGLSGGNVEPNMNATRTRRSARANNNSRPRLASFISYRLLHAYLLLVVEVGKSIFPMETRKGGSIVWKSLSGSRQGKVTTTAQRLGRDAFREHVVSR